jgi:hypothetical protein
VSPRLDGMISDYQAAAAALKDLLPELRRDGRDTEVRGVVVLCTALSTCLEALARLDRMGPTMRAAVEVALVGALNALLEGVDQELVRSGAGKAIADGIIERATLRAKL